MESSLLKNINIKLDNLSLDNITFDVSKSLIAGSAVTVLTAYTAWKAYNFFSHVWSSPLHDLPGPPRSSFIFGNLNDISSMDAGVMHEKWTDDYGPVIRYGSFFGTVRLCAMDMKVLSHVFTHSYDWTKPEIFRRNLGNILGKGILVMEGDEHKKQRRVLNPVFSPSQIKELAPLFVTKSKQLKDIWLTLFSEDKPEVQQIDVLLWLSRATLDVIGQAGFGYRFDALDAEKEPDRLQKAFSFVFAPDSTSGFTILQALATFFPIFSYVPTKRNRKIWEALRIMNKIGDQLIARGRRQILAESKEEEEEEDKEAIEKDRMTGTDGRDLLTTLVRANMDTDLPDSQRMSDLAIRGQVPTFLVAGHETSSTQTTWTLFALSKPSSHAFQKKLREELLAVPTSTPTLDQLNALPYLDAVLRESLRLYPAVNATVRVADKDDVIPVSKPFVDRKGRTQTSIRVQKGESIIIPIIAAQRYKGIWGEDSHEFKPERWFNLPPAVQSIPGVTNGLIAFLNGSRSCIGYRFALAEIKALLFTLIREFEFDLALPEEAFTAKTAIVQRPYIKADMKKGAQMPLLVKRYKAEGTTNAEV